jgi:hypothetical protein
MRELTRICARLPRRNARRQNRPSQSVAIADVPHIELAIPLLHHPVHAGERGLYVGKAFSRPLGRALVVSGKPSVEPPKSKMKV